jgi:hypothetical protein
MRVGIDQTGKDRSLAKIDYLSSGWNLHLALGADIGDPLTLNGDNLSIQELAGLAVEQPSGTHR